LVAHLAHAGHTVHWYVRRPEARQQITQTGHLAEYLPGVSLPVQRLTLHATPSGAIAQAQWVLLVVPTAHLASQMQGVQASELVGKTVATAVKGLMPGTAHLVCEFVTRTFHLPDDSYCAILGPGHAEEVARGQDTYLTVCGTHPQTAQRLASLLHHGPVRANPSPDVQGGEMASALKNVYAVAAGLGLGLGYGDNFMSVLVANALVEMAAILEAEFPLLGRNIAHSLYAGDLLVTAYSPHSRNRRLGLRLGQGEPLAEVLAQSPMVAEGYNVARLLRQRGTAGGHILRAVQAVLVDAIPPQQAFATLARQLA
jgi:glycerol-3-phosphate dehydrogenase (NAD(P)+)